jgi:threonine dehydrogenase-like Zn-dependent dehydrogenase
LKKDSNILILGGGPIGIAVIQALRARGCGQILVSELSASRQKFAKQFGADVILDPRKDDIVQKAHDLTDGMGVDIVFDCAGVAVGLEAACKAIKIRGTVVNVAIVSAKGLLVFRNTPPSLYSLLPHPTKAYFTRSALTPETLLN